MRNLLTKKTSYTFDYPEALAFADKQNGVFWTFDEIDLEKDVHSILTDFTPSERHGVTTALKLFTKYELIVGNEYWSGTVKPNFQHPDIELMADAFCYFESNVHARFYNRINELLGLATEEFHHSWQYDPVLASRINYLDTIVSGKDLPLSLAVFSMMEGCVLYSSFAFLKHFQSNGKNKLSNLVAGINFSNGAAMQRGVVEMTSLLNGLTLAHADIGTDMNVVEQPTSLYVTRTFTTKLGLGCSVHTWKRTRLT